MTQSYRKEDIATIAKENREKNVKQQFRRGLYENIFESILHFAKSGKTLYIHPIDRELWNNEEIEYTKWKLRERGFTCKHKYFSKLSDFFRYITDNHEQLIVDWQWQEEPKPDYE